MTGIPPRILAVEDDDPSFQSLRALAGRAVGGEVVRAATHEEAVERLEGGGIDLVLAAHGGLKLLRESGRRGWTVPIILLTGREPERLDVEALRAGAADSLARSELTEEGLARSIRYALERARAEAALRESRRALSTLLANLPGMAYRCRGDQGWMMEFVSEGAAELTGYTPAQLEGRPFEPLIVAGDRERVRTAVREAVESGRPYGVTYRITTASGREKWVMEQGRAVPSANGREVLEGIISDVTAQKAAEAALQESERYFRSLVENASEAVAVVNEEGIMRYASPPLRRLTGYDLDERVGRSVFELVDPRDRAGADALMAEVLRSPGSVITGVARVRHRAGSLRTLEITCRNLLHDSAVRGIVLNARDVTAQVVAERRLAESEQRYRSLFDLHPDAVFSLDTGGRFATLNEAAERLMGYPRESLLGISYARLVVPEQLEEMDTRFARVVAGQTETYTAAIHRGDGARRELQITSLPVVVGGQIVGVYGIARDVTEAQAAERRLRVLDRAVAAVSDGIVISDARLPDHPVVSVNPGFEALAGYPAAEVLGRNCRFLQGARTDPAAVAVLREAVEGGHSAAVELLNYRRDGSSFWNFVSLSPVRDDAGTLTHFVGVLKDVTERHRTDEELRSREERLRALIEHAHDVITVLEGDFCIRFASPAVERVLGYGRSALHSLSALELVHPEDQPRMLELLDGAIRAPGEPQWAELRLRHAAGGWRVLETVATSLLHEPALLGIVLNSRDITERREAEEALEQSRLQFLQSQKMEAVGRLAGGVAHDFNNLLTAIRGNADLILMDLPEEHPSREDAEEIRRAAERATGLTRQLLAFSRRQVLQTRVLSLNDVVGEMEKMLTRLIGEDVELMTLLDPQLARVAADPGQMEQVILNLVVNARDAMPDGGVVVLETANADLDEEVARQFPYVVPGPYVMLAVRDTGMGMDRETREQAFEPFFTTKPPGKGTGLGLSTVYGIIKQSEGYVWIDSEPGQGTAVRVYLPRVEAGSTGSDGSGPFGPAARGVETVLVVEDEWTVRNLTARVLERSGYSVLVASDGYEALRVAAAHEGPLHLLLTDLVMPRLGGIELARRLRDSRPEMAVLYSSGYGEVPADRRGDTVEGAELIEKPYGPDALARKVREALDAAREGVR